MGKSPSGEKNGLKKGPWTPEEDQKLIDYVQKHGHGKWRILPKNAGLKRCGKSCRLRWTNYLRPDIKRGRFSFEEEETIIQLHSVLGNKWSTIAASLPGRTDNEIKNYWNTHIKKRLLKMGIDPVTHAPYLDPLHLSSILNSNIYNSPQLNYSSLLGMGSVVNPTLLGLLAALLQSSQNRTPDVLNQISQQNPFGNSTLLQSQSPCSQPMQFSSIQAFQPNQPQVPIQDNPSGATPGNPLHMESQIMKAKFDQISPSSADHFSYQNTDLPKLWQSNGALSDQQNVESAIQSFSSPKLNSIVNNIMENQILHSNEGMSNFNIGSLLSSTPSSSSPSTLNSPCSTTFVHSATEDERDTYCSNMLMYNIPNSLNDPGFL